MAKANEQAKPEKEPKEIESAMLCPDDVVEFIEAVRAEYHMRLAEADIAYVFIPKAPIQGGRVTLGATKKLGEVDHLVARVDFIVRFAYDQWVHLTQKQRAALADHELCHCATDGAGGCYTLPHEVEAFTAELERHGMWRPSLEQMAERIHQHVLAFAKDTT